MKTNSDILNCLNIFMPTPCYCHGPHRQAFLSIKNFADLIPIDENGFVGLKL